MDNLKHILPAIYTLILLTCSTLSFGQSSPVFTWAGGSGNWHEPANWKVDGESAEKYPSQNDIVFISAANDIEIRLNDNAFAEALTTSGHGAIMFKSNKKTEITLNGNCLLSENTVFDKNLKIRINGDSGYYNLPERLTAKIDFKSKANYSNLRDAGKGTASCPFFSIVPNPTGPTCNGFNNGIASVEVPLDGVGPYTYQWIGGPSTRQWNNVGAGTYTVIIFDVGQGVPCNTDVFINEPGPLTVFSMNASPPLCADVCNGTAAPIVIGGNGIYTLNWSSGEVGFTAEMLCPIFTLNIVDQKGCVYDTTYTYPSPPDSIKFNAAITQIDCFGNDNGSIDLTITGGVGAFSQSWTGPNGFIATTEDINNLEPGTYTVSVEDVNGCLADTAFTITENPLLTATSAKVDNICGDGAAGSISLTVAGGATPYNYAWSGPDGFTATTKNLSGLNSGLYEVTITDAASCTLTLQITIDEPVGISVAFTTSQVHCFGESTGSATASASGGTAGYSYSWTGPDGFTAAGPGISNVQAGLYEVTVTDVNLCSTQEVVLITQPDLIEADFTVTGITCNNGADGAISANIIGGTLPYTFAWTGPGGFSSADQNIFALQAGTYSLTLTDANLCVVTYDEVIENPAPMAITAVVSSSTCSNGTDGAVDITVSGGTEPYSFSWTGPSGFTSTSEDISDRPGGTYMVTVTDANLCSVTGSYTINSPAALGVTVTKVNASCFGSADGSISVVPTGGVGPYNFIWVGPAGFISFNQNNSGLLAGSYSVQIMDSNGCVGFVAISLSQPPKINITGPVTSVTCFNGSDGAIDAIVNGGTPGYTYSWSGPNGFTASTQDISGISAGTYTLTVTDAILCSKSRDYIVNQPLEIAVNASVNDVLCAGESDGSISVTISNGVAPYALSWSGPGGFTSTMPAITGLAGGTYTLTVTDFKNCSITRQYEITETVVLTVAANVNGVLCYGDSNGTIQITPQGGAEPYTISWNGPDGYVSSQPAISDLAAGDYQLTLSDDNGCTITQTITVGSPVQMDLNLTSQDISCSGAGDGSLSATISGGTTPYFFAWTGPNGFNSANPNISSLDSGLYTMTVTDRNFCTISESALIIEPAQLVMMIDTVKPGCLENDGSLTANVTGGTAASGYTYSWLNAMSIEIGTGAMVQNLGPGTYTIIVTDDNGCSVQKSILLTRVNFNIAAEVNAVSCYGSANGNVTLTPISGTAPYTYTWNGPDGYTGSTSLIENLEPGQYEVTVVDDAGCELNMVYDVDEPVQIGFSATIIPESCPGEMDGSVDLTLSGGIPGFLINWSGPDGFIANTQDINSLNPGLYTVSVTDIKGCTRDTAVTVGVGNDFGITLVASNPVCAGEFTGSINAAAGTPGIYSYSWSGPNGYTSADQNITNLDEGLYIVSVTNENGCTRLDSTELFMPDPILIDVVVVSSNCLMSDGSASAVVSGGVGVLAVRWLDNNGNELASGLTVNNLSSGVYVIEVSDDAGCIITQTVVISDSSGSVDGIITAPVCVGGDDASIDITVIDGTEPFVFEWTDGTSIISTTEDIAGLSAGVYNVKVTDDNGCIYTASFNVIDPAPIAVSANVNAVSCNGGDGSVSLVITNATLPVSVEWTGPGGFVGTGTGLVNLDIGVYYYTITDQNLCSATGSVEILAADPILASAVVKNVLCGGDNSGSIDLTVSGGVSPLSYSWTDETGVVSTIQDIADITAGTYTVVISDAQNCSITETYTVTENPPVEAVYTIVHPGCATNDGSISVAISGGVVATDYFISWTDPDGTVFPASADLTGLGVGIYTFSASDDNGCSVDTTITLSNPDADIAVTTTGISCPGAEDGSAELSIAEVEEPYTVSWTGPGAFISNQKDIYDLQAGMYAYTITGNNGCEYFGSAEISPADSILVSAEVGNSCYEENSGYITLTISAVNQPVIISWTGPDGFTSGDTGIEDLAPGIYESTLTDANGCSVSNQYEILESPEITVDIIKSDITCFGDSAGTIDIVVAGGIDPLTITWNGPNGFTSNSMNLDQLPAGEYALHIADNAGCTLDSLVTIIQSDAMTVNETVVAAGCSASGSLGMIELMVSGGTPAYTISWIGPDGFTSIDFAMTDLLAGVYEYTITDNGGCQITGQIEILDVDPVDVVIDWEDITCSGEQDGQASANISGGLAPYLIQWSGPGGFNSTETSITELFAGSYRFTLIDSAGCSFSQIVVITEPEPIDFTSIQIFDANCSTSPDGAIDITTTGGTEPYSFAWTGPNNFETDQQDPSALLPGLYNLVVTDTNGCEGNTSAEVSYSLEVAVYAGADTIICESGLPISFTGTALNLSELSWTYLDGNEVNNDAELDFYENFGDYVYVLHGTNGFCEATDTLFIQVLKNPDADAGTDKEVFIEEVFTLGGSPTSATGISYQWSPNPTGSLDISSPNPTGYLNESTEFTLVVTDENGCIGRDTVYVEVLPDLAVTSGFTPNGDGVNDTWIIDNMELFPNNVVNIFNRWGQAVYSQQSYNSGNAWDGTFEGKKLPVGTYYYTIELKDERFPDPITGPITIYR